MHDSERNTLAGSVGADDDRAPPDELSRRLLTFLRERLGDTRVGYVEPPFRMPGGNLARVYRFRLRGAPSGLDGALVLRLYPCVRRLGSSAGDAGQIRRERDRVLRERVFLDTLAGAGYPVPRVHLAGADITILGGPFLILQFLAGDSMMSAPVEDLPDLLGAAHAALHRVDPEPAMRLFPGMGPDAPRFRLDLDDELRALADWSRDRPLFRPAVAWLAANRPPDPPRPVICHGDFHPFNVLIRGGEVAGVLDWSDVAVAPAEMDVARSAMFVVFFGRRIVPLRDPEGAADAYLAAYRKHEPLDDRRLDFFRVWLAVLALINPGGGWPRWQQPGIPAELAAEIRRIAGVGIPVHQ